MIAVALATDLAGVRRRMYPSGRSEIVGRHRENGPPLAPQVLAATRDASYTVRHTSWPDLRRSNRREQP